MAAIIEFSFPTEEFALKETLDTHPEAHIEIERVVADDPEQITPYMWVRTDDFDAFEATLEDDPSLEFPEGVDVRSNPEWKSAVCNPLRQVSKFQLNHGPPGSIYSYVHLI